jgi:hypothetical protein
MVKVGDVIEVAGRKIGDTPRRGTVSGSSGALLRVRWESGDETTVIPGPGTLTVVSSTRSGATKKTGTAKKASGAKKSTKRPEAARSATSKKAASKKAVGTRSSAKNPTAKKASGSSSSKKATKRAKGRRR